MTRTARKPFLIGIFGTFRGLVALVRLVWIPGLLCATPLAASWERDPSFDVRLEAAGRVAAMAAYTNGSILIGGTFHRVGDAPRSGCALLNSEGELVRDFVPDLGESAEVLSIAVQPDQKILVTGRFTLLPPRDRLNVVRLNSDGSLDESFKLPFDWHYFLPTVAVTGGGEPLFGGALNAGQLHVFRLGVDGTPDSDFSHSASISSSAAGALSLTSDPEGGIYLAGAFVNFRDTGRSHLVRLRRDGTLDSSFASGVGFDNAVMAVALTGDGRLFAGGVFRSFNNVPRPGVARLNRDGALDLDFDPRELASASISSLISTPEGGVVVGGRSLLSGETNEWGVIRLTRSGAVDRSFLRIPIRGGEARGVVVISPGEGDRTWVGGFRLDETAQLPGAVLRVGPGNDGQVTGVPGIARYGVATAIKPVPGGGLIIGGDFERVNAEVRTSLARILPGGMPDAEFAPQGILAGFIKSIEIDRQGRVYAGVPDELGLWFSQRVRRFLPDGSEDPTYSTPSLGSMVWDMHLVSTDELIVCGSSNPAAPELGALMLLGLGGVARSNAFPGSLGLFSTFAFLPMPDGGVICGGDFVDLSGSHGPRYLARLNSDGTLDAGFRITNEVGDEQPLDSIVTSITRDSKGRLIVGGEFQRAGTQVLPGILRIHADGRMDSSFHPAFKGFNVDEVKVDSEDRIVARGDFFFSESTPNRTVVRVLPDGSVDPTFPVITNPVGSVAIVDDAVFLSTGATSSSASDSGRLIKIAPVQGGPFLGVQLESQSGNLEIRLSSVPRSPLLLETSTDLNHWIPWGPIESVVHVSLPPENRVTYFRVVDAP